MENQNLIETEQLGFERKQYEGCEYAILSNLDTDNIPNLKRTDILTCLLDQYVNFELEEKDISVLNISRKQRIEIHFISERFVKIVKSLEVNGIVFVFTPVAKRILNIRIVNAYISTTDMEIYKALGEYNIEYSANIYDEKMRGKQIRTGVKILQTSVLGKHIPQSIKIGRRLANIYYFGQPKKTKETKKKAQKPETIIEVNDLEEGEVMEEVIPSEDNPSESDTDKMEVIETKKNTKRKLEPEATATVAKIDFKERIKQKAKKLLSNYKENEFKVDLSEVLEEERHNEFFSLLVSTGDENIDREYYNHFEFSMAMNSMLDNRGEQNVYFDEFRIFLKNHALDKYLLDETSALWVQLTKIPTNIQTPSE